MPEQSTNIRKTFNYLIRAIIVAVTYIFVYRQIFIGQKLKDVPVFLDEIMAQGSVWVLVGLLVFMMLLNWGLEAVKWQVLIRKIEKVSFFTSFKAVMTGVSVSLFTPNRTGDYLGRVFILKNADRIEGTLITIIGSIAQLIVTLCLGLFAFLAFFSQYLIGRYHLYEYLMPGLVILVPVIVFLLVLSYFKISLLTRITAFLLPGKMERWTVYGRVFSLYDNRELLQVLLLSLGRYIVFSTQFLILLHLTGIHLPVVHGVVLVPVIYLIMAAIPSFALTDLGVRGSVSVFVITQYFQKYGGYADTVPLAVFTASSVLWLINLILPAILGTLFVFSLKFFRR